MDEEELEVLEQVEISDDEEEQGGAAKLRGGRPRDGVRMHQTLSKV